MSEPKIEDIVPAFGLPASLYVRRIKLVCQNSGINITDAEDCKKYTSILISRLPLDMIDILPTEMGFKTLLEFVESWGGVEASATDTLSDVRCDIRPSLQHAELIKRLKNTFSDKIGEEGLKELAWKTINDKFLNKLK